MRGRTCLAIVLAAGEGTRMRSTLPKALNRIGGRTLIEHVLGAAKAAGCGATAIIVGPDHDEVAAQARSVAPKADIFVQRERRGTAHAVLAAKKALARKSDDILVMFSDTPLVRAGNTQTIAGGAGPRRSGGGAGVQGQGPCRLWPAADAGR